jgi:hypothetical protein
MSNRWWKFIIFKEDDTDLFFESGLGDELLNKPWLNRHNNSLKIKTSYWSIYWYNLKTKLKHFEEYEDKYSFWWKWIKDIFTTKSNKEKNAQLVLPEFNSIEQFLGSPFFWDVVAIALEEEKYKRKTFSECCKEKDFMKIYHDWWNIFTDKDSLINEKVILEFKDDSYLPDITNTIKSKIEKMKSNTEQDI